MIGGKLNQKGYTLIEIMVATSLFVMLIFIATNIFTSVNEVQRITIANQTNQDNVRYFMEVIAKEMRQAIRSDKECDTVYTAGYAYDNQVFRTANSESELYFKNKHSECVKYYINSYDDVSVIVREIDGVKASSTPSDLVVDNFKFDIVDNLDDEVTDEQPRVTLSFDIKYKSNRTEYEQAIRMQTTISSRNYRE
ncbi:MAG: prepilin-type N-terminal cleavage/methylation domain-containing protein [Patescibacteria group bacterium]|nr:prepilin-type N-terminal cleavage/methylation domain-containing protein [Patescibacteria group bacterium]